MGNIKLKLKMQANPSQNRYMNLAASQQLVGTRPHMQARMPPMPTQSFLFGQQKHQNAKMHKSMTQKGATQSLVEGDKEKDAKTMLGYAAAFTAGMIVSSTSVGEKFKFVPKVNVGVIL